MIIESHDRLTETWIAGTEKLLAAGGDVFTSLLHVLHPAEPDGVEYPARLLLDEVLIRRGAYDTQTVANTLFPQDVARGRTANELYERYLARTYPRIRQLPPNRHGTYFHRLIYLESRDREGRLMVRNPLAECIAKMKSALGRTGTLRSAYELAIYRPVDDAKLSMGFPCLSHISLKLDPTRGVVHLTALYRNQYYLQRAYGNLLGLSRLQAFIAHEVGLGVGELACHATHAHLDAPRKDVRPLLLAMRNVLATPEESGRLQRDETTASVRDR